VDSLTTNNVSRRAVLMGGAALGAAGAAGLVTRGLPAAAQAAPPAIPRSRVGATFDLFPFKKGTTWDQAVDDWNSRTGTTMRCWKVYYGQDKNGHGVFPASISAQIHTIIKRDIQALISVKPTVDTTSAQARTDRAKLRDALIMFKSHKLIAEVCLWQEVSSRYMTAAQYHAYVQYYGPTIRRYYPLVFDAPGYRMPSEWRAFNPGREHLDGYALDFYCPDLIRKGHDLTPVFDMAGDLPVGVWEIGNTASSGFMPTPGQLGTYMTYLTTALTGRMAERLPVGSVAWYNGPADAKQSGQNEIAGTHPNPLAPQDIRNYRTLYKAVNKVP
jgi:hypothetical protein